MKKLEGKVALVTGGSTGIGLASAKRLASDGAYVFITGRRQAELAAAVKEMGPNAEAVQGDVAKLADLDKLYAIIKERKGHLDVVFANAGVAGQGPFGAVTEEAFDREMGINVKGTFFTVQKALPLLREGASIILNASIVASKGLPGITVYSATKAAIRSFARTWTTDLRGRKIRVNVLSPGPIDTPGLRGLRGATSEQLHATSAGTVPAGRLGHVEDIASAVAFLASDESSFMAGSELFVDGGVAQV